MVAYRILFLAGAAAALPLNINLGAYSPAVIVGDGSISFGGDQDISGLMSVLEGAAINAENGAAKNGAAQSPAAQPVQAAQPAQPEASQPPAVPENASTESSTSASLDPKLQQQAQQIAALQGIGKEIAPREEGEAPNVAKRQNGFDRALQFAEAALVKGPKIQLGTGEGGAGVGIIVDNNQQVAARPGTGNAEGVVAAPGGAAEGAAAPRGLNQRRDFSPKLKMTTMYVRSGVPASLQNGGSKMSARDVGVEPRVPTIQITPQKRDVGPSPNGVESVNLNLDSDQGVTITFVETVEDEDDEDDDA